MQEQSVGEMTERLKIASQMRVPGGTDMEKEPVPSVTESQAGRQVLWLGVGGHLPLLGI